MKNTTLVIMAAGIGSRFGGGIKQLEPVGPNGEIIMDYSIYDALEAGFNDIVFIIRKDLEKDFREVIGDRIARNTKVSYAFQEMDDLPDGFTKPEERRKPWGTGQAILVCKDIIKNPFVVINADDYYGKEAFVKVHDYLVGERPVTDKLDFCMAGFILGNTLSENGGVTRGICQVDDGGMLTGVIETHDITKGENGAQVPDEMGGYRRIDDNSHVSMNMWGFTTEILGELEHGFVSFLQNLKEGDIKSEYLLPTIVDRLIRDGKAQVKVLETKDKWFGVTYKEDRQVVADSFKELIEKGVYHTPLFS
ncbi:MAG: sugar phosphate nucleotidyltransferase [Lachnospiraceae bacterium]|nr:nucleotidyltransferase [Robinsoniella sp.]MDY3766347.1 sugar phosphate nucleotidyltransferase [Lachnospiraceae bacterium]